MAYIGKITNKQELQVATNEVLSQLKITIVNKLDLKVATTLLYWIDAWSSKYLPNEKRFNYKSLKYYERGQMVQANLGFKVGSEEGGLHYCLVVENDNDKFNKTMMVIPLASLDEDKSETDINKKTEVFLGYGILKDEIEKITNKISKNTQMVIELTSRGDDCLKLEKLLNKDKIKLKKLEKGTIALINQMCALSKIRIYTPKHDGEELSSFKLCAEKLDEIDEKIKKLYLKPIKVISPLNDD